MVYHRPGNYLIYFYARSVARLVRSLSEPLPGDPSLTATMFEERQPLQDTLGAFVLSLTYVTEHRLGVPLERVAAFNRAKLQHREGHGKSHDIHLDMDFLNANRSNNMILP